jgi:branched-chain amino acid transport system permease protein
MKKSQLVPFLILLVLVAVAPLLLYRVFVMRALCFALFACAFNMLLGYAGLLSFGHALFFGGAAYVSAYSAQTWGWPPELAILFGTVFGAVFGYIVGMFAIRRQGIYFAMITLALAQMFYFFCLRAEFTGGENGIQGVPRGHLFHFIDLENPVAMYCTVAVIFLIGFGILHRAVHSPFGQVLKAIRENEPRAISLGYDVNQYKLIAFVLSAGLAGTAGATKAIALRLATLGDAYWGTSGEVILMTLVGGVGTTFGPIAGAVLLVAMENYLGQVGTWVTVIEGGIFIVCTMAFRRGLFGELGRVLKREL